MSTIMLSLGTIISNCAGVGGARGTAMATELLSLPSWPFTELLRLNCALTYLHGRPLQGGFGCAPCPVQGCPAWLKCPLGIWEVLKEATGL